MLNNVCIRLVHVKVYTGDCDHHSIVSPHPVKKYNELFPKEKKEKAKKGGEVKEEGGKGSAKKQQKTQTPKKKEAEPAAEEDEAPKPAKFVDPYTSLPTR